MPNLGEAVLDLNVDDTKLKAGLANVEGDATSKLGGLKVAAGAALAGLGAIGAVGLKAGEDIAKAMGEIQAGTGAAGEELKAMHDIALTIAKDTPEDIGEVATAIADVNTATGLTGPALEEAARAALIMGRTLGEDVSGMVRNTGQVLRSFNLDMDEAPDLMGKFAAVAQDTGISAGSLARTVDKLSFSAQAMGLSMDETIGLVQQFELAGLDTAKASAELNAAIKQLQKEGKDASVEWDNLVALLKSGAPETEKAAVATDLLGKAGVALVQATADGRINLDNLTQSMRDSTTTIEDLDENSMTWGRTLDTWKDKITLSIGALFDQNSALGAVSTGVFAGIEAFGGMALALPPLIGLMGGLKIATLAQAAANLAALWPIGLVILGIAALGAAIFLIIKNWDDVTYAVQLAWHHITKAAETGVRGGVRLVESWVKAHITAANAILNVFNSVISAWNNFSFKTPAIKVAGRTIVDSLEVRLPQIPSIPTISTAWSLQSAIPSFTSAAPTRQASGGGANPLDELTALGNRIIGSGSGAGPNAGGAAIEVNLDGATINGSGDFVNTVGKANQAAKERGIDSGVRDEQLNVLFEGTL